MSHPCGVQPESMMEFLRDSNAVRSSGLGKLALLSDEAVLNVLGCLSYRDLANLSVVSKALYCFCNHQELWKALTLEDLPGVWEFQNTWRDTYLSYKVPGFCPGGRPLLKVAHFYSDLLHQTWLCAALEIDPSWLEVDNIDRRSGLAVEAFRNEYERANRPVILTDAVAEWPAMSKWTKPYLQRAFKGKTVLVGDAPMPFESYCRYADAQSDELPLYLFDKGFLKTAPQLGADFEVPPHFRNDLFAVLGDEARPDHRWLIVGPHKSGSTWHVDPNATCAWNAVVAGAKKWVMYPPGTPPPGVKASDDGADVACPVSLMEWFLSFYPIKGAAGVQPLEATVRAGEVLFVPRGWWHAVLNVGETAAVTQNFLSEFSLEQALAFLSSPHANALVSGVATSEERATLHDRFLAALKEKRPEVLKALEKERAARSERAEANKKLVSCFKAPEEDSCAADPPSFSFRFGFLA